MAHIENLKKLRRSKNLTQKELAEVIGVDRTTYVKYESGDSEPSFEKLIKLADFFEVSLDYLFGREPGKKELQKDEETILLKYRQMDEPDRAKLQERSDAILENEKYSPPRNPHRCRLIPFPGK